MEVINYLVGYKNLKIAQDTDWFSFSLDSVLLANFITLRSTTKKIIDLGTGNAPIPLILSTKTNAKIIGVEIQEEVYKLALKSIQINGLESKIEILNEDVKRLDKIYETDTFDTVVSNPPFFKYNGESLVNDNNHKTIARHEILLNIDEILRVTRKILKNNGNFGIIHRPERMLEILNKMQQYNIEPKRIQFVYPKENLECNMMLIEGTKNGRKGLKILPPLYVRNIKGEYTEEVRKMFGE
jgi:tRNA1(Val) A37 N6-methylase TrmN6